MSLDIGLLPHIYSVFLYVKHLGSWYRMPTASFYNLENNTAQYMKKK